jgi:hypothetical protein
MDFDTLSRQRIPKDKIAATILAMRGHKDIPPRCKLVILNVAKIDKSWKKQRIILEILTLYHIIVPNKNL